MLAKKETESSSQFRVVSRFRELIIKIIMRRRGVVID